MLLLAVGQSSPSVAECDSAGLLLKIREPGPMRVRAAEILQGESRTIFEFHESIAGEIWVEAANLEGGEAILRLELESSVPGYPQLSEIEIPLYCHLGEVVSEDLDMEQYFAEVEGRLNVEQCGCTSANLVIERTWQLNAVPLRHVWRVECGSGFRILGVPVGASVVSRECCTSIPLGIRAIRPGLNTIVQQIECRSSFELSLSPALSCDEKESIHGFLQARDLEGHILYSIPGSVGKDPDKLIWKGIPQGLYRMRLSPLGSRTWSVRYVLIDDANESLERRRIISPTVRMLGDMPTLDERGPFMLRAFAASSRPLPLLSREGNAIELGAALDELNSLCAEEEEYTVWLSIAGRRRIYIFDSGDESTDTLVAGQVLPEYQADYTVRSARYLGPLVFTLFDPKGLMEYPTSALTSQRTCIRWELKEDNHWRYYYSPVLPSVVSRHAYLIVGDYLGRTIGQWVTLEDPGSETFVDINLEQFNWTTAAELLMSVEWEE